MIPLELAYATTSSVYSELYILLIESIKFFKPLTFSSVENTPLNETSGEDGKTTDDLTDTQASVNPESLV